MTDTVEHPTVGVIGCGKIGQRHLNAYGSIDEVDVRATDLDEQRVSDAERLGATWVSDTQALLTDPEVDAIDVCTPIRTHTDLILRAFDEGKDVLCEKPLAPSVEDVHRIRDRAEASDNILLVGYLYRYHPAFQLAKEIINKRIIGEPYYGIFRVGGRGSHRAWKHKADRGGGVANEMLVHMLDLLLWYFDGVADASAPIHETVLDERVIDGRTVAADAADLVLLDVETVDGSQVVCQSDLLTPSYMNYVEVHGSNGSLWTTILDTHPTLIYCEKGRGLYDQGKNYEEFSRVDLFEREVSHFVDCVRGVDEPHWDAISSSLAIREVIDETLR